MTDKTVSAADIVARRLAAAGCRFAFGIPGGEVISMVDALDRAGIAFVLTKHENAAGFMAEGVHHMDGAPGIMVATLGPGVVNGVNVVANAWQDQVPLIVLSGCVDEAEAMTYTHQVFDHGQVFRPITKASFKLADGEIDTLIDKAVSIATDGRPGPVHIDLPISATRAHHSESKPVRRGPNQPVAPAPGPALDAACAKLASAQRPLVIAGVDVLHHGADAAVADFCRFRNIPLITTYKAKGVLPEDDPLALGGAGLSPTADKQLLPLVKQADVIVLAGYDPIEMRAGWRNVWNTDEQFVVDMSAAANTHYMHVANVNFVCDIGAGLKALNAAPVAKNVWPGGEPAAVKAALATAYGQGEAWGPIAIAETVRDRLPRDGVATVDSGAHRIVLSQVWNCYGPRQLIQSTALCTMGCALPMAIGAKLAAPDRPVVAFTGDAGLEMILGELATLRDLKIPVAVVVFVDASLALIELKQRGMQLPNVGVDFGETDFAGIAEALGGHGVTCQDREGLSEALDAAWDADRFTLIACRIDRKAYDGRL